MCGRYNVIDAPALRVILAIRPYPETRLNIAPGGNGQIVYETEYGRTLDDAYWSLLIEQSPMESATVPHQNTAPSTPDREAWEPAHSGKNASTPNAPSSQPVASMNGLERKGTNSATAFGHPAAP